MRTKATSLRLIHLKTTKLLIILICSIFIFSMLGMVQLALAAPGISIKKLSPTSGSVGTAVTITGSGFVSPNADSYVLFGTLKTDYTYVSSKQIETTVPAGVPAGSLNVYVCMNGTTSKGKPFTVIMPPTIITLDPDTGPPGSEVNIIGDGFGDTRGTSIVTFNGVSVTDYLAWSPGEITVKVPFSATTGDVCVFVSEAQSNGVPFTLTPLPLAVREIYPCEGAAGTTVEITGTGFGTDRGTSKVVFSDIDAEDYVSWSDNEILVKVPRGATAGPVYVIIDGATAVGPSFGVSGKIVHISSLDVSTGTVGTTVEIMGSGFSYFGSGTDTVTFNGGPDGISATVISSDYWEGKWIKAVVPAGALTGNVYVTTDGVRSNPVPFTVPTTSGSEMSDFYTRLYALLPLVEERGIDVGDSVQLTLEALNEIPSLPPETVSQINQEIINNDGINKIDAALNTIPEWHENVQGTTGEQGSSAMTAGSIEKTIIVWSLEFAGIISELWHKTFLGSLLKSVSLAIKDSVDVTDPVIIRKPPDKEVIKGEWTDIGDGTASDANDLIGWSSGIPAIMASPSRADVEVRLKLEERYYWEFGDPIHRNFYIHVLVPNSSPIADGGRFYIDIIAYDKAGRESAPARVWITVREHVPMVGDGTAETGMPPPTVSPEIVRNEADRSALTVRWWCKDALGDFDRVEIILNGLTVQTPYLTKTYRPNKCNIITRSTKTEDCRDWQLAEISLQDFADQIYLYPSQYYGHVNVKIRVYHKANSTVYGVGVGGFEVDPGYQQVDVTLREIFLDGSRESHGSGCWYWDGDWRGGRKWETMGVCNLWWEPRTWTHTVPLGSSDRIFRSTYPDGLLGPYYPYDYIRYEISLQGATLGSPAEAIGQSLYVYDLYPPDQEDFTLIPAQSQGTQALAQEQSEATVPSLTPKPQTADMGVVEGKD